MKQVVDLLVSLARCPVEVREMPERLRPVEVPHMLGDASRLHGATGWQPRIPLEQTLADALEAARAGAHVA
jgi:GDP-4-dehydro-6-deoxy-D-mannose reductase